jgi:hypothetical protein
MEDLKGFPLDLLELHESSFPIFISIDDNFESDKIAAWVNGFRFNWDKSTIDCEIQFTSNSSGMIAEEIFRRKSKSKLNPVLKKIYVNGIFEKMNLKSFLIAEDSEVHIFKKDIIQKNGLINNIYNKIKYFVKN